MFLKFIAFFSICILSTFVVKAQITVLKPRHTELLNQSSVEFVWAENIVGDYEVAIATNASFTPNYSLDTVFNDEFIIKTNLNVGVYYWRIRNLNIGSSWSPTYSFEIININVMPGLSFWLNPESGFVVDASNKVSLWQNQIGSDDAFQINPAAQPTLIENSINSFPIIQFDGINDHLEFPNQVDIREAFVVCKHSSGSQNYAPILGSTLTQPDYHGGLGTRLLITSFTSPKIVNGSVMLNNQPQTVSGILKPTAFAAVSISSTDSVSTNAIGRDRGFTARSWNGDYAEVIFFTDSLSPIEKSKINRYLQWKYSPFPFLGKDVLVCGEDIKIGVPADNAYSSITWSTGLSNVDSITINQNGTYWVTVQSFGLTFRDTILISGIIPKPQISVNSNVNLCFGDSLTANYIPVSGYKPTWSNGDTTNTTIFKDFSQAIFVNHIDTNGCLASSDQYELLVDSLNINSSLGPDKNVCIGGELEVSTSSNGFLSYNWSTGDTTSSIVLVGTGSQTITLELSNQNNCVFNDTIVVNILNFQAPTVAFTTDTACLNDATQFSDISIPAGSDQIVSWKWHFGNNDSAFVANPQYSFNSFPNTVSLTVETDSGCINNISQQVFNHQLPVAFFDDFVICANDSLQINNTSSATSPDTIENYLWQINGQFLTESSPRIFIPSQGIETISLIVETDKGCLDSISKNIEVYPPLQADFSFNNICLNDTIHFLDITNSFSVVSRQWNFGYFNQGSVLKNPSFFYPSVGLYTISLNISNAIGCTSDTTKTIEIRNLPEASAIFEDNCFGNATNFYDNSNVVGGFVDESMWKIENEILIGDSVDFTFDAEDVYTVYHEITDNFGCTDDTTFTINIYPLPEVDFDFTPNYGTAPLLVAFNNLSTGGANFLWNFGENNSASFDENPNYTYTTNGTYDVQLIVESPFNCRDSLVRTIPIIPTELDVELSNLVVVKSVLLDGSQVFKARVDLKNVGSRLVENIDLKASINQETKVLETWNGILNIGQSLIYELESSFLISDEKILDYLCVEAFNVNDNTELNFNNNKVCKLQQGTIRYSTLYPNPSKDVAFMDVVTARKGSAEVRVFDLIGKEVLSIGIVELQEGFNQLQFNCANIQAGKYIVKMIFQDEVYSQTLIIRNQ